MALKLNSHAPVTVVTAGVRVQVDTEKRPLTSIIIQAANGNSGRLYVGDSTVSSTNGIELNAGESLEITGDGRNDGQSDEVVLADLWIDASANAQIAKIAFFVKRPDGIL